MNKSKFREQAMLIMPQIENAINNFIDFAMSDREAATSNELKKSAKEFIYYVKEEIKKTA